MARHRSYSIEFKRQVVQELLGGEAPCRPWQKCPRSNGWPGGLMAR